MYFKIVYMLITVYTYLYVNMFQASGLNFKLFRVQYTYTVCISSTHEHSLVIQLKIVRDHTSLSLRYAAAVLYTLYHPSSSRRKVR